MNLREIADKFTRGANAAGQEARYYAERFDSKLAELNETVRASQIEATNRTIVIATVQGSVSQQIRPNQGTYWKVTHIAGVWEAANSGDPMPYLALNSDTFPLLAVPGVAPVPLSVNFFGMSSMVDFKITDKDYIVANHLNGAIAGSVTRILLNIEEYTLDAIYDARMTG